MKSDKSRKRFVFLCVAPATILFFIFMILPTLNVFRMSLYERGAYSPNETFVGLKNFQHLLRDAQFIRSMQNMILLVVTVTLITFAFALVFAAILTREKIKGQNFFRIIFYIPNILSVVVISGIFSAIYKPENGMLNSIIGLFRNMSDPILWKGEKLVIPSIIIAMVWQAIGYYMVMYMASIKQNAEFYGNPWALPAGFYWQNFVNAWNGAKMGEYMLNSVIVTALALALLLVVALPAAYCLSRFHFKGCKVLNTLFMAGLFINVNYIVVPIFLMLRDSDVWLKGHFGSGFLLNNLVVLAVVYAATALPFTIYLLSGYFATLPHDFEEAAYIDGASYFSTMTRIIFPMAKPSIITIILFNFLSFWNEYIISMTLMSSTKAPRTLPVGLLNLMQAQQSAAQYGTMYAGLVLVMLPTLILYICVQRQLTQGMTVGGLKG